MIVCPQPQAAEIGLDVMRRGGNAVDAAVTCAFVQGVIDPQMCGLGGCGAMLVHGAQSGGALSEFYATAGSRGRQVQWESRVVRGGADWQGRGWRPEVLTRFTAARSLRRSLRTSRPTTASSPGMTWRATGSQSPSRFGARIGTCTSRRRVRLPEG